jgi:hypothetical protein
MSNKLTANKLRIALQAGKLAKQAAALAVAETRIADRDARTAELEAQLTQQQEAFSTIEQRRTSLSSGSSRRASLTHALSRADLKSHVTDASRHGSELQPPHGWVTLDANTSSKHIDTPPRGRKSPDFGSGGELEALDLVSVAEAQLDEVAVLTARLNEAQTEVIAQRRRADSASRAAQRAQDSNQELEAEVQTLLAASRERDARLEESRARLETQRK